MKFQANFNYLNKSYNRDEFYGSTPLSIATLFENYKCCLSLLEAGANVNLPEEDVISISYTSSTKTTEQKRYPNKYCPIHLAVLTNNCKIITLLMLYKADIDAKTQYHGDTPLGLALQWNYVEVIKLLVSHGAIKNYLK